jgi:hypothetical protein
LGEWKYFCNATNVRVITQLTKSCYHVLNRTRGSNNASLLPQCIPNELHSLVSFTQDFQGWWRKLNIYHTPPGQYEYIPSQEVKWQHKVTEKFLSELPATYCGSTVILFIMKSSFLLFFCISPFQCAVSAWLLNCSCTVISNNAVSHLHQQLSLSMYKSGYVFLIYGCHMDPRQDEFSTDYT